MQIKGKVHGSDVKLPTFRVWLKNNPVSSDITTFAVEKILWSDKYRTITFFTEEFRYSFKCASKESLAKTCGDILDSFEFLPGGLLHSAPIIRYNRETGEVVIVFQSDITDLGTCIQWKQFDWGLVTTGTGDYTPNVKPKKGRRSSPG